MASEKTADKAITGFTAAGQEVILVPKGTVIPDDLEALKALHGVVADTEAKAVAAPTENKARRAPRKK